MATGYYETTIKGEIYFYSFLEMSNRWKNWMPEVKINF